MGRGKSEFVQELKLVSEFREELCWLVDGSSERQRAGDFESSHSQIEGLHLVLQLLLLILILI